MSECKSPIRPLKILVVDDEANIRKLLSVSLEVKGHAVTAVSNFRDAAAEAERRSFDVAFVDLRLGTTDGLDLIPVLLASTPWLKIVVITAYSSIPSAVEAIRRGATDYLAKPFTPRQVNSIVRKLSEVRLLEDRVSCLEEQVTTSVPESLFSSNSPAMQRVASMAREVANSDASILLRGENGTGKSTLARAIHHWSKRAGGPFGQISCPTLSLELLESELFGHVKGAFTGAIRNHSGRIARCQGGTLLLDEMGDLPLTIQPKLLRFLQEKEYEPVGDHTTHKADVRIITATHVDLESAVREGRFREDLLYRLNVIQIDIPPLRERREDVASLALHFLMFFGKRNGRSFQGFTEKAMAALTTYDWPGNVRELGNVIERVAILCKADRVGIEHLPDKIAGREATVSLGDRVTLAKIEEEHVRRVLARSKSLQEAAGILGIDQATLWRKRKHYGV